MSSLNKTAMLLIRLGFFGKQYLIKRAHYTHRRLTGLTSPSLRSTMITTRGKMAVYLRPYASIWFSSRMTLLLKPKGDNPDTLYRRLMLDWKTVPNADWAVRPIAVGGAHDRTIERARLKAVQSELLKHFTCRESGQYAFGTSRGSEMLILAQRLHQHKNPSHTFLSCDGTNAYNVFTRTGIARGILAASQASIRDLYPYFLMGHRTQSKIYFPGERTHKLTSRTGVRQGNPISGAAYSLGQHAMLLEMHRHLEDAGQPVRSGAIVDDTGIQGPPASCAAARAWLVKHGPTWGYHLNEEPDKTTLCVGPAAAPAPQQDAEVTQQPSDSQPDDLLEAAPPMVPGDVVAFQWQADGCSGDGDDGAPMQYSLAKVLRAHNGRVDLHLYRNIVRSVFLPDTTLDLSKRFKLAPGDDEGKHIHRSVEEDNVVCHVALNKPTASGALLSAPSKAMLLTLVPVIGERQTQLRPPNTTQRTKLRRQHSAPPKLMATVSPTPATRPRRRDVKDRRIISRSRTEAEDTVYGPDDGEWSGYLIVLEANEVRDVPAGKYLVGDKCLRAGPVKFWLVTQPHQPRVRIPHADLDAVKKRDPRTRPHK